MPLEKTGALLREADRQNTAVIAFNCGDYNMIYAAAEAAERARKPVIITLYPYHVEKNLISIPSFAETVRALAKRTRAPLGLHLDHCTDAAMIFDAIQAGFLSVMYDGSMLPYEENIQNTREIAKYAHFFGVDVEAELGHVGQVKAGDQFRENYYTAPDKAAEFCERTGADALAVAFGSAHGFYQREPKLDIGRLKEIDAATDTPLVLHGGTGIPDAQLEDAFRSGINKLNFGTEFFYRYYSSLHDEISARLDSSIYDIARSVQKQMTDFLAKKLELSKFSI